MLPYDTTETIYIRENSNSRKPFSAEFADGSPIREDRRLAPLDRNKQQIRYWKTRSGAERGLRRLFPNAEIAA